MFKILTSEGHSRNQLRVESSELKSGNKSGSQRITDLVDLQECKEDEQVPALEFFASFLGQCQK